MTEEEKDLELHRVVERTAVWEMAKPKLNGSGLPIITSVNGDVAKESLVERVANHVEMWLHAGLPYERWKENYLEKYKQMEEEW